MAVGMYRYCLLLLLALYIIVLVLKCSSFYFLNLINEKMLSHL